MNTPRIVEDRIGIGMIENRKGLESMGLRAWEWVLKSSGLCGRGKCKESSGVCGRGKCMESSGYVGVESSRKVRVWCEQKEKAG